MINNKLMLVYGLKNEELNLLKNICLENNLPSFKIVNKNMCEMKLRDIIKGINLEVEDVDMPEEKVVIFNNFSDTELDLGVKKIKEILKPIPIMAVVTETSIDWQFKYLVDHLMEEREWYRKQNR
ncbi:DUF3783 domain-containing protein [Clostridium sp. FAM 1755]|uniref:DUF3783 domain-containing protein n=1 Tax=Clostridium botulinum TaxID=1491 RepID=A0A6M0T197_CLOBO|nr:DUF3783 domain-containing protein [Clostridium sporogenes]NFA61163.1 DUF3783 domain-containing protein [Clostridium botulinum]NFI75067.1 DUF3783 domain-containing protein [Clostridium sporogenes]NFL72003.1 DUF3783 domain-containing protein [Clostridium sporogenes]NFM25273.1 DUF3783 domain-containing protein [Clostridium sporogenes]NFN88757.1 DUF3783 domain-containing protein [Clostridium sporogenes]